MPYLNIDSAFLQHVLILKKQPHEIVADSFTKDLVHMAMGIAGEAGEVLELVKKIYAYGKPIDRESIIKELGDLEFYLTGFRAVLGLSRNEILYANMEKLKRRYPQGYSDKAAVERVDTLQQEQEKEHGDNSDSANSVFSGPNVCHCDTVRTTPNGGDAQ